MGRLQPEERCWTPVHDVLNVMLGREWTPCYAKIFMHTTWNHCTGFSGGDSWLGIGGSCWLCNVSVMSFHLTTQSIHTVYVFLDQEIMQHSQWNTEQLSSGPRKGNDNPSGVGKQCPRWCRKARKWLQSGQGPPSWEILHRVLSLGNELIKQSLKPASAASFLLVLCRK